MKIRNLLAALGLASAIGFAAAAPANAYVTSHCFNHSISGDFICHYYEAGSLIAIAGGGGMLWLSPSLMMY